MFELIISNVRTGRVQRKFFPTRGAADRAVARHEERLTGGKRPRSLGEYRVEVRYRDDLAAQRPAPLVLAAAA
jgi:hypothetical protein